MIQVCLPTAADCTVEFIATIWVGPVATIRDCLGKPLSKEGDGHPHVDVIRVSGTARPVDSVSTKEVWIVSENAHLNGFFGNVDFPELPLAKRTDVWVELFLIILSEIVPFAYHMNDSFRKNCRRVHPATEFSPGDWIGGNGCPENASLAKESEVNERTDEVYSVDGFGYVD